MEKLKQKKKKMVSYSHQIPSDLLMDIFSRVPAKSAGRFRCLSKFWRSKLGLPYFTELFLTMSLARPRLFFAIKFDEELLFFSSPQPQNPVDNSSLVATRYKCLPTYWLSRVYPPLNGLVLLHERGREERLICNPVTGESITITLPEVKASGPVSEILHFGYDPINKQFKVLLRTTWSPYGEPDTHQVLTLGSTGEVIWRRTMDPEPYGYDARYGETWINGVLYYGAIVERGCVVVCFDFCSEKFSFIKMHEEMCSVIGTLVNYKGKLGLLVKHRCEVVLWLLEEDAGNHKWSQSVRVVLNIHDENLDIIGMTGAGETVFSSIVEFSLHSRPKPFYIVYYNIERNTFCESQYSYSRI